MWGDHHVGVRDKKGIQGKIKKPYCYSDHSGVWQNKKDRNPRGKIRSRSVYLSTVKKIGITPGTVIM